MRISIEPTSKIVELETPSGGRMPARIWEGTTDRGTPVHCFITRIAPTIVDPPDNVVREFTSSLGETRPPSAAVQAISLRFVL